MNTVLLADADVPTRIGLRVVLAAGGFDVVGEASDAETAVGTALERRPDIALIAAGLPGGGIDAVRRVSDRLPGMRLVVVSDDPGGEELLEALRAGATGYLGRDVSQERLPAVLRGILAGEVALPRRHTQHLVEELRRRDVERAIVAARANADLTDREWDVFRLLAAGAPTAEMAYRLGISQVTVRRHVSAVLAKLNLPDRASAAALLSPNPPIPAAPRRRGRSP